MKSLKEKKRSLTRWKSRPKIVIPRDTVRFCREILNYKPYRYSEPFLRDQSHFIANKQARQTGKTFNGMAKILHTTLLHPSSLSIITAPKFDQVKNIAFENIHDHLNRMKDEVYDALIAPKGALKTIIRLRNKSRILAEPPVPERIRGHKAILVYLMEANFIREDMDLYTAVLFMLNTTNGYLIAESTCWNTDSVFYKMFHDPAFSNFSTHSVVYTEALPPNGPLKLEIVEMIKKQLEGDPARWKREMLVEWGEDINVWISTTLIILAQDSALNYLPADHGAKGEFYVGVDFGKHIDHSIVSVINLRHGHRYLVHCHRFPLETSYGAVIGYIKMIQDNWRYVRAIYADKTGVGDYLVEDMTRGGLHNVEGVNFTIDAKEQIATALKEEMRRAVCPKCGEETYITTLEGEWVTTCPIGCKTSQGNPVKLRPFLHIPYDQELYKELNVVRSEKSKIGKLLFNHPEGTKDDRFWATGLSVLASIKAPPPPRRPLAISF